MKFQGVRRLIMDGKITYGGYLEIKRGSLLKKQDCPYSRTHCGDWCPLFGKPTRIANETWLDICDSKTMTFTDFQDERE